MISHRPCAVRRGITLLELMIALTLIGVVTLLAHLLMTTVDRGTRRIDQLVRSHADDVAAAWTWRELVLHATASPLAERHLRSFAGGPDAVQFTSWCRGSNGHRVTCAVYAHRHSAGGRPGLLINAGGRAWQVVTEGPVSLRYLDRSTGESRWISVWEEARILPAGIALIGERDTLVTRIGTSG